MSDRSLVGPIVLGVALTGVTGICLYLLLKKDDDCVDGGGLLGGVTARQVILEVKIPRDSVGIVIGRQGANIREIQAKTDTKINFRDELETEEYRVVNIRGLPDDAQMAEILIHQTIAEQPRVETVLMTVPTRVVGRIIGRNGDNIRSISRASRCKVDVERDSKGYETQIMLKGSSDSIEKAKSLIEEIVDKVCEGDNFRREGGERSARLTYKRPLFLSYDQEEEKLPSLQGEQEELRPTGMDHCIEVFVSAVSNPGAFWVQKIGPHSVELDKLTQDMTQYYEQETNREYHELTLASEGDIVVTQFSGDESYYRARVVMFNEDSYDVKNSTVELDFVDFGDFEEKKLSEVFGIKTDFLSLKFQAVQCSLAKVRPFPGCEWSEEATNQFVSLSHCALWKMLWAKILGNKPSTSGALAPCVELIDTSSTGGADRNIGDELVKLGLAQRIVTETELVVERETTRDN